MRRPQMFRCLAFQLSGKVAAPQAQIKKPVTKSENSEEFRICFSTKPFPFIAPASAIRLPNRFV
jgi:hypothetical protein